MELRRSDQQIELRATDFRSADKVFELPRLQPNQLLRGHEWRDLVREAAVLADSEAGVRDLGINFFWIIGGVVVDGTRPEFLFSALEDSNAQVDTAFIRGSVDCQRVFAVAIRDRFFEPDFLFQVDVAV